MKKIVVLSLVAIVGGAASLSAAQSAGTASAEDSAGKPSRSEVRARLKAEADTDKDGTVSDVERKAFHEKMKAEFFTKKDVNGDGELSQDELDRMPQEAFGKLDKDSSGGLSVEEMKGHRGHGKRGCGHGHFLKRMDGNSDGKVTKAEMRAAADAHFAKLDANKDGFVTEDEVKTARDHGKKGKKFAKRAERRGAVQLHAAR